MKTENPFLSPTRVRAALRSLELQPTRGMGQNFLIDGNALDAIVAAGDVAPADTVIEVGPGLGVLTWELAQRAGHVIAVELDRRLAERLRSELPDRRMLTIVQGDILTLAPEALLTADGHAPPRSYKVVSNLPYAITSPVLRHFLESLRPPELMVVLVQREVAERIAATPGDMSVLAHAIQIYAEPEVLTRVPSEAFIPAPAVESAVLRLRVRATPAIDAEQAPGVMRVIKAGFLHARKQIGNALPAGLAAMGLGVDRPRALAALDAARVATERRAETLSLAEWEAIYLALAASEPQNTVED
jgi:16S rRNA (adenine1518-N6/adenine1519-N6)-dimethyltransferase